MATSFSPTTSVRTIFQNPPKPLLSLAQSSSSYALKRSFASSATYATQKLSHAFALSPKPFFSKGRRVSLVRAATIEEIEAEKAAIEKDAKNRMERTIDNVRTNFSSIRTGRANPAMLDKIEVEYYGTPVSLKSIAQISTPDASSLLVQPYDKSSLKAIEKAIVSSDLGMTPNNDGELIRLSIPQLTSDRRKELSKIVAKQAEEGKVALRNIRRDALKAYDKLEKEKKLSEDNVKDLSSDLQKLTDEYMKKVDTIFKQKEKELLTV
ncbi:ribosome-recycling factor, chloroplastic [Cajanus cajan]|uniref:ribosome-recycling factor, chloroplastic n=1 Tax=Cajanus cajan TaxID=3821 RepID=UPI00098DA697|nr:ribosome-recycling factor, chloroplastic [Cajanus cajan]XP_020238687.1 ribosome-recycling factor, chloroplastic [Cajanus cajan]